MEREATRSILESTPTGAMAIDTASGATQITEKASVKAAEPTVTSVLNHRPADIILSFPYDSSITVTPLVAI